MKRASNPVFDAAKAIVNQSLSTTLSAASIDFKGGKGSGGWTWYKLKVCPICADHRSRKHAYECGFGESVTGNRRYIRTYKCFDGGNDAEDHKWAAFVSLGLLSQEQVSFLTTSAPVRPLKVVATPPLQPKIAVPPVEEKRAYNTEWMLRLGKNLAKNATAVGYLSKRRWDEATIKHFALGLSTESRTKDDAGREYRNERYLVAPIRIQDGTFIGQYAYYKIPGITVEENPTRDGKGYCAGKVKAYFASRHSPDQHRFLIVCDGLKDVWSVWQALNGSEHADQYCIISSTHGGGNVPESVREGFFNQFEKVFLAHDNDKPGRDKNGVPLIPAGDAHAIKWSTFCTGNAYRVRPPGEIKDWNDFFCAGRTAADFLDLLKDADSLNCVSKSEQANPSVQRTGHAPVAIEGEWHNGYLYYTVNTLVRTESEDGTPQAHLETVAVRSDRSIHRSRKLPKPKGVSSPDVYQLWPDGTIITGPLRSNPYASWEWESIQAYLERKSRTPSLRTLLGKMEGHLRASAYLPIDYDYTLLALFVATSFCQRIFDAVPLGLMTGEAGSGKSTLAKACSDLAANAPQVTGVMSAATFARQINDSKGFIAIDDLEAIGQGTKDAEFGDLVQSLKLSYNKATATKIVTNTKKNFAVEKLDFFGVKLMNNTSGVSHILGTRMLKIQTRIMPKGVKLPNTLLSFDEIRELRNQMHSWTFENANAIAETYKTIFPAKSTRSEEISAPLKVLATLAEDPALYARLEAALDRQCKLKLDHDSPEEILTEAVKRIIKTALSSDGVIPMFVSILQAQLETRNLVNMETYGKEYSNQLSVLEQEKWVGRYLHTVLGETTKEPVRTSLYSGKSIRAYELRKDFLEATLQEYLAESGAAPAELAVYPMRKEFTGFCAKCETCEYSEKCEVREHKMQYLASLKGKKNPNHGKMH